MVHSAMCTHLGGCSNHRIQLEGERTEHGRAWEHTSGYPSEPASGDVSARAGPVSSYQHKSHYAPPTPERMSGDKDEIGDIQSSPEWGRKTVSAMDTHGIDLASSRTRRPLPWCILEHRRPQRSRNTHSHRPCRRSRSRAHRPRRRRWGPPRRETSMCLRPARP